MNCDAGAIHQKLDTILLRWEAVINRLDRMESRGLALISPVKDLGPHVKIEDRLLCGCCGARCDKCLRAAETSQIPVKKYLFQQVLKGGPALLSSWHFCDDCANGFQKFVQEGFCHEISS